MAGIKYAPTTSNSKKKRRKHSTPDPNSDPKPYNHNLYFILERELFLQERGIFPTIQEASSFHRPDTSDAAAQYCSNIEIPPLPARYSSLILQDDWYVNKKKKRAHVKVHGIISFRELAAMVASSWKKEDEESVKYFDVVANKARRCCYPPNKVSVAPSSLELVAIAATKAGINLASILPGALSSVPDAPDSTLEELSPKEASSVGQVMSSEGSSSFEQVYSEPLPVLPDVTAPLILPQNVATSSQPTVSARPGCLKKKISQSMGDVSLPPPILPIDDQAGCIDRRVSQISTISELDISDYEILALWTDGN